uniref:SLC13 family permease n=1 Tax=Serratia quinivorans TaxID=137545 RepID=UPI0035C6D257
RHITMMGGVGAVLSAFMNNVAALALLMPVDIQTARKAGRAPGLTLMPLSFATILGGMATLIGTPPNIIIATIRERSLGEPFRMFDFAPVGLACAVVGILFVALVGWRLIPQEASQKGVPFDALGFVLTGIACFGLMFGLDLINHPQLSWLVPALCILGSLALGTLAVRHAKRTEHPLINLWAMRIKSYAVTIWGGTLFRIAIGAVPFLLPLLFQIGFGLNAFDAGLLVLAVFAGNLVMKPFTSAVLYRFRFRTTLVVNGLLNAATIFACALLTPQTPTWLILALLFVSGLTRSMQFTALNTLAFSEVPQPQMNGANTLFNVSQQMGSGLGIAIGALALRLAEMLMPQSGERIPLVDFQWAFVVIGVIALLAVVDCFTLNANAGSEVRQRKPAATVPNSPQRLQK